MPRFVVPVLLVLGLGWLGLAACALAQDAAAETPPDAPPVPANLLKNGDFTQAGANGAPVGWEHRTKSTGYIKTHGDAKPSYVEIGIKNPDEDSFIQQTVAIPKDIAQLKLSVTFRYFDIKPGEKGYQKGSIQARFTIQGKETGAWIDIASLTGTDEKWATKSRSVKPAEEADGLMLRLALYKVKSGRLEVSEASIAPVTAADLAVDRAKYRQMPPFGEPVSDARYERLRYGININNWFCQPWNVKVNGTKGGFNPEFFAGYITSADLKMLREAGFRNIRLTTDPSYLMDIKTGALIPTAAAELDKAIKLVLDHDLAIIIDIHPKTPAFKGMAGKPELVELFVKFWGELAKHLAATDPERVFLEVMNEPGGQGYWNSTWPVMQDRLLNTIRAAAPRHTLIANPGGYQIIDDLQKHTPHPDRNVIYAVHYYHPSPFTHQGATWMKTWYHPLRNVPWPLTAENIDAAVAKLDRSGKNKDYVAQSEKVLRDHVTKNMAVAQYLKDDMRKIAAWAKANDRRIVIGEFGVYAKYVAPEARVAYLADLSPAMAEQGFAWSMWDYCGAGFDLVANPEAPSAQRRLDAAVVKALNIPAR